MVFMSLILFFGIMVSTYLLLHKNQSYDGLHSKNMLKQTTSNNDSDSVIEVLKFLDENPDISGDMRGYM